MFKNTTSQKITLFVFDSATGLPKTGDATNLTAYVSKDDGTVTALGDTSATETDATNAKGMYVFDLTQAETNGDKLIFSGKSSTAGIVMVPQIIYPYPTGWSVTAGTVSDKTGYTVSTVSDKTGYTVSTVSDKTGYSLSTAGNAAVFDGVTSGHTTTGSFGKLISDANSNAQTASTNAASASSNASQAFTAASDASSFAESAAGDTSFIRAKTDELPDNVATQDSVDNVLNDVDTVQNALGDTQATVNDISSRIPSALGANGNMLADVRDFNGVAGTFSGGRAATFQSHAIIGHNDDGTAVIYSPSDTDASRGSTLLTAIAAGHSSIEFGPGGFLLASAIGHAAHNVALLPQYGTTIYTTATDLDVLNDGGVDTNYIIGGHGIWKAGNGALFRFTAGATTLEASGRQFLSFGGVSLPSPVMVSDSVGPHRITATELLYSQTNGIIDPQPPEETTYYELNCPLIQSAWGTIILTDNPFRALVNGGTILAGTSSGKPAFSGNPDSAVTVNCDQLISGDGGAISFVGDNWIFNISQIKGFINAPGGGVLNNCIIDSTGFDLPTIDLTGNKGPILRNCQLITDSGQTYSVTSGDAQVMTAIGTLTYNKAIHANVTVNHETLGPAPQDSIDTIADQVSDVLNTLHSLPDEVASQNDIGHALDIINTNLDVAASTRLAASSYTAPPSAATVASAVAAQTTIASMASTVATNLDAKVSAAGGSGGGGTVIPVSQVAVPLSRLFILKPRGTGLIGEVPLFATVGEEGQTYGMSFQADLPANGRLASLDTISVTSGQTGGIDFSDDDNDFGVDRGEAKFKFTCSEAGTYQITVGVSYDEGTGGGSAIGVGTIVVRPGA